MRILLRAWLASCMVTSTLTVYPTLNWPVQEIEATTGTPLLMGGNRAKALRL
jgi:hypothetical protein